MRLRATVVVEYEPNPDFYAAPAESVPTLAEMARIDQQNWREDPFALLASFETDELAITVEPIESKVAA
jgi:hypothetical protein